MHASALINANRFFRTYIKDESRVLDVGSQDVNGSMRDALSGPVDYVGVDFVAGKGVDIVITDPYVLPFDDESFDVVVSSSCFEHSEMFWVLFLEIMRVLRPAGLFYLNVPSNGPVHRYPVDCWRFYPDSGIALENWGRRNGLKSMLLESFVTPRIGAPWNDFVAVFVKDESRSATYTGRIFDQAVDAVNATKDGVHSLQRPQVEPGGRPALLERLQREIWRRREHHLLARVKRMMAKDY